MLLGSDYFIFQMIQSSEDFVNIFPSMLISHPLEPCLVFSGFDLNQGSFSKLPIGILSLISVNVELCFCNPVMKLKIHYSAVFVFTIL